MERTRAGPEPGAVDRVQGACLVETVGKRLRWRRRDLDLQNPSNAVRFAYLEG
jgi:hypothetical protein